MSSVADSSAAIAPVAGNVPAGVLAAVSDFYHRSLYLQGYRAAAAHRPLREWDGTAARIIGGRLAMNIGSPRLGSLMHVWAWRKDRSDPVARYYYARRMADYHGPLAAWRFMRACGEPHAATQTWVRADWYSFHAAILGRFRDFDAAEQWMARAEQADPVRPWVAVERAHLFEMEDRYPEALKSTQRALALRPWYRPAVQSAAHLLQLMDRDQEALELLGEAAKQTECASIWGQLAMLQTELRMYSRARDSYERCVEFSPLVDEMSNIGLSAVRSDAAYYSGDLVRAAELAEGATKNPFYRKIAERLKAAAVAQASSLRVSPSMETEGIRRQDAGATGRRVILDVGFVRQHHMTCAPATLSALSRFWSKPASHLELAEAICYDGTPAHSERNWAVKNGWLVREFRVTWENARALIDRKIPFTLTTMEPTSGHLQAVIGYDELRGTLLVRDPYERHFREFMAELMFEWYRASGPRGMALIPQDRPGLLDGVALDDAEFYDQLHALNSALERHDRPRAWDAFQAMAARDAGHRLTIQARGTIAAYDSDYTTMLASAEAQLKLFPGDPSLLIRKLNSLRHLARREQRLELLRGLCRIRRSDTAAKNEEAEAARFDPVFWRYYAQELSADARNDAETLKLARKCIRYRPADGSHYFLLAQVLWGQLKFGDALECYRYAVCLSGTDERMARSYFSAAQRQGAQDTKSALQLLERRFSKYGKISGQPARTLHWTYERLERQNDAFALLEDAIRLRPDDGDLMLYAADSNEAYGRHERAAELLAAAEKRSRRSDWLRTNASLARNRGDLAAARKCWEEIVALEPLAIDAQRALTLLLAELDGRAAALEHLRAMCKRFPYNFLLHQLRTEWVRDEDPVAAEAVLRHLIEIDAQDAWTRRELAAALGRQRRFDEGLAEAEIAHELDPANPFGHFVTGRLQLGKQRRDLARDCFRRAIGLSIDSDYAIRELLGCCDTPEQRRAELAFIHEQIVKQVNFGDGLLAYRAAAADTLESEALLTALREAQAQRPDLWHAWSALIQQLTEMDRTDEALKVATQATEHFPLAGRLWMDLATVRRARNDYDGRIAALRRACEIDPAAGYPVRELAAACEERGNLAQARTLLEQAAARSPLDPYTHGCLAEVQWKLEEKDAALERMRLALKLDPSYGWAWATLRDWSGQLRRPEVAAELARELTRQRPGDARAWLTLARTLTGAATIEERLAAADKAAALDIYSINAHELRAVLLTDLKRYDDAQAACRPAAFGPRIPTPLLGREAWILARRGDLKKAVEMMREALKSDANYYWGWARLADWCEELEDHDAYYEAANNLVRLAPQEAVSYGYRANARINKNERDGAKADFRRSIELQPDYRYGALGLVDLLQEDGEIAAAQQVLSEIDRRLPGDPLILVRFVKIFALKKELKAARDYFVRLASVEHDSDWALKTACADMAEAGLQGDCLRLLKEAVGAKPDLYFTWQKLADLHREHDAAAYLKAAEQMVRLKPENPTSFGVLGAARQKTGQPEAAAEAFKQALELAPDYKFASNSLFDVQLELGAVRAAEHTLEEIGQGGHDAWYWLRVMRLGFTRHDPDGAAGALKQLCALKDAPRERFEDALREFRERKLLPRAQAALSEALECSPVNDAVAELWAENLPATFSFSARWKVRQRLDNFRGNNEARRPLAVVYLELLKKANKRGQTADFVRANAAQLHEPVYYWGQAGYYLSCAHADSQTVGWFGHWRERKDLKPWMLLNLAMSQRRLKHDAEARAASEAALKLAPDECSPLHALWLAADAALAGDSKQARALLNRSDRAKIVNYYKFLRDLVVTLLDYQELSEERRATGFDQTWSKLAALRATFFNTQHRICWGDPALLRTYMQCATRIGELGETFWTRTKAKLHCVLMR